MLSIFISYAWKDGAELALRLQKDLTAAGFDVWIDTERIHAGGKGWRLEIEETIEMADAVLALLTPGSYASKICRAEQMRALRKRKCVIPLLAAPGSDFLPDLEEKTYIDFSQAHAYAANFQSDVAVTPDGKSAVSASWGHMLKVWDLDTGRLIATFHCDAPAFCCAFADQQRIVAGDQGGRVYILSLEESAARRS